MKLDKHQKRESNLLQDTFCSDWLTLLIDSFKHLFIQLELSAYDQLEMVQSVDVTIGN